MPTTLLETPPAPLPGLPEWFNEDRAKSWLAFTTIPAPVRTDENWRYADLKRFDISEARFAEDAPEAETEALEFEGLNTGGARLVFLNDRLIHRNEPAADLLTAGLVFLSLREALEQHGELVRSYYAKHEPQLGSDKYAALHRANAGAGTFVYAPRGLKVPAPLEIHHWIAGEHQAVFPTTIVIAEEGSEVTVVDHFHSASGASGTYLSAMLNLHAGDGSKLTHVAVQNLDPSALCVQLNTTEAGKDAAVMALNVNLGARTARVENRSILKGTGGRSDMLAVSVGDADQTFDLRTLQDHLVRNCVSDLLYKNALGGSSRAIFSGLIRVEEGAHQTDAYQTNRSLILDDNAESVSMPGLEILADDVKCSHGSTTSDLHEDELFYLLARGISPDSARRLLVMGFLNEVLQRLNNPELEEYLGNEIGKKFARVRVEA